ncbi:hypothetical protein BPLS_P5228 [Bathymodiolus platifrons methanotrophic gill symbiont]|nr:hypothetical protein BPLS_P5228 [Bathymodiolus platifrons methanotrophic gill symbiont]
MKHRIISLSLLAILSAGNVQAIDKVSDEASLIYAFAMANVDSSINKIVFAKNARISLNSPVIYTGSQNIMLLGNGAIIDGANAGNFTLNDELLASTEDGSLIFNTAGDIKIQKLSIVNCATRGVLINIPEDAQGDDIQISLDKVKIRNSALHGLHIDDNADEFDGDGAGSKIGIELYISNSSFVSNGTGAIDFDGIRVDERGPGDIHVIVINTQIDGNGGDGMELDEAGAGNVDATLKHVTLNDNGFYNPKDLDDGFDIDEAGAGNVEVSLFKVMANRNKDEGVDIDETDAGDVKVKLRRVIVMDTTDEGIKIDEEGEGNVELRFSNVMAMDGGDDGIQVTEQGKGRIEAELKKVSATDNNKYGVKMEQWDVKGEGRSLEEAGRLKIQMLTLSGNGKGDEPGLHNVFVK